jgi:hypothetical protein
MGLVVMDRASRFSKGLSSPLESVNTAGNPFATLGVEWCPRCRMEVDCDTQAAHRGDVYVYKRTCNRCGKVVKSGSYNAPMLLPYHPLMRRAYEWITEPGVDRRGRNARRSR